MGPRHVLSCLLVLVAAGTWSGGATAGVITGKVQTSPAKFRANTIVYVVEVEGKTFEPTKDAVMDQKNLTFTPHVLPVVAGTTVQFLNSDKVLHNVFSPDKCADKFNLGSWPQGESREYTFKQLGCQSVMLCNVHPEMEAFVLVLQNPYFAVTDAEGNFEISDVPPGKHVLRVWNEKLKAKDQEVVIPEEDTVEVVFELTR